MADLERAKQLIAEYCKREFGEESSPDFTNIEKIPIAYTTTEDDEHEIQVYADLVNCEITKFIDGKQYSVEWYDNLAQMNSDCLEGLDFDELVGLASVDELIEDAAERSTHTATVQERQISEMDK